MSFFEKSGDESRFRKTEYLKLTPGTHTIRIVQNVGKKYYQHWLGMGVECLGEACPQCKQNKRIIDDIGGDPQEAYKYASSNKVDGFVGKQARGAVNVLDRTPIKVCPNCQTENRPANNVFAAACSSCGQLITEVEPNITNNIKVFSRAASVFEQIDDLDRAVLDKEGEPRGVTNFDLNLHVVGNNTVPVPADNYEVLEVDEEKFFDLENVVVNFTVEEMEQRMKGASFKEIFQSRRSESEAYGDAEESAVEVDKEKVVEIESEIESMFE
jgi:hypothetical protein